MVAGDLATKMPNGWAPRGRQSATSSWRSPACCRREQAMPAPAWGRGAAPSRVLPPTVQAVIAARIDQLSAAARDLVRRASVFPRGRVRSRGAVARSSSRRKELLDEAESEGLLEQDRGAALGCGGSAATCCATSRTTALAKRERQRLHLRVGEQARASSRGGCALSAHDRLSPGAGRARCARPESRGPLDRGTGGRRADPGGRRRAAPDRIAGPRSTSTSARSRWPGPRAGGACASRGSSACSGKRWYWLGDFDEAEARSRKAMTLAEGDDRVTAHAARFLADVTLTVRGDDALAAGLLSDRSLPRGGSAIPVCWRARSSWRGGCRTGAGPAG